MVWKDLTFFLLIKGEEEGWWGKNKLFFANFFFFYLRKLFFIVHYYPMILHFFAPHFLLFCSTRKKTSNQNQKGTAAIKNIIQTKRDIFGGFFRIIFNVILKKTHLNKNMNIQKILFIFFRHDTKVDKEIWDH